MIDGRTRRREQFLKIKGVTTIDKFDSELTIGSVVGIKKIADFTVHARMDTSPEKRVELHCHTKMSDMDGVSDVKDIIKTGQCNGDMPGPCHYGSRRVYRHFPDAFIPLQDIRLRTARLIPLRSFTAWRPIWWMI